MPSFLIKDLADSPFVFIHNPKTGGQALRQVLLSGDCEGPVMGRVPNEWSNYFKFAFVRNPFDRLISAWKMFSEGIEDTGWKVPPDLESGMSLADFLEIVTDETIPFVTTQREGKIRLRNHTLPQTHPFYCLDQADFIGRFENYDEDVATVFEKLGIPATPPEPRHVTKRGPYPGYFDEQTRLAAEQYYQADLDRFDYKFQSNRDV